jgi:multidrug resistance efflux pump
MLELLVCALFTIVPDYLFRRFRQGKRIGHEITLFSVWYELRYGLTACLMLTIALFTVIHYYHPKSNRVVSIYRTVTILPERGGRVAEVVAGNGDTVSAGDPIFSLVSDTQEAAAETARRRIAEAEAAISVAGDELAAAAGTVREAESALKQAEDELAVQQSLLDRGSGAASVREVERLQTLVSAREAAVEAAEATRRSVETRIDELLPAQRASAEAALAEAQVALDQSTVYAGIDGELQQFALQPGDIVTALGRPAGILVPPDVGAETFIAAFDQISAQALSSGMIAEMACPSLPFRVIPMRLTDVQDFLPSGQFRPTDRLLDVQDLARPGSVMATLRPLYPGTTDAIPRGSSCIVNAYSDHHAEIASGELSGVQSAYFHVVDTVGVVRAFLLRIEALLMPVTMLVLGGH